MKFTEPENIDLERQLRRGFSDCSLLLTSRIAVLEAEMNTNYLSIATLITCLLPHFLELSVSGAVRFDGFNWC